MRIQHSTSALLLALWLLCCGIPAAQAQTTLYNGTLGTTPGAQGWTFLSLLGGIETPPTLPGQPFTTLNTTAANSIQNGYSRISPTTLDRALGYTLRFDVRVTQEVHANNNRAGFSVIAVSSDQQAIELGFWTDRIFAQNSGIAAEDGQAGTSLFTQGENVAFDTTASQPGPIFTRYDLSVQGDNYRLFADGSEILAGGLRNYAAFSGLPDPYETPNFLFLGDDTTSARASFDFAFASVAPANAPELGSLPLLLFGFVLFPVVARRLHKNPS